MAKEALAHLRVLEISESLEVAFGGKVLADYGAEVIKIENTDRGDPARYIGPYKNDRPDPEASGLFLIANTNKKGMTLDITSETGKQIFLSMVKETDILLEGYKPGEMERLGLGYEDLKKLNPGLVMLSVTPFGQSGPYKDYKAYPLNICHGGLLGTIMPMAPINTEIPPIKSGGRTIEVGVALDIVPAVLGGIFNRTVSGEGCYIELSIQDVVITMHMMDLLMANSLGVTNFRFVGAERPFLSPIKCKDGYFMLFQFSEALNWNRIKNMLNFPELKAEKYQEEGASEKYWPEILKMVEDWSIDYTKQELFDLCQKHLVSGAPVSTVEDLYNDVQLNFRGYFVNLPHEKAGTLPYPSTPAKFARTPAKLTSAAPMYGEHNEEILIGRLGFDKEKINKLNETNII